MTTDRDALLKAIKTADAKEVTPRLVYADWLEEFGTDDVAAATIEFIRLSCKVTSGWNKTMPRAAYPWLKHNWQRLVPNLLTLHEPDVPWRNGKKIVGPNHFFRGRNLWTRLKVTIPNHPGPGFDTECLYSIELEFWKGFVTRLTCWSGNSLKVLIPALRVDQPLAQVYDGRRNRMQYVPWSLR